MGFTELSTRVDGFRWKRSWERPSGCWRVPEQQFPQLEIVAAGILEHSQSVEMELPEVLPEDI